MVAFCLALLFLACANGLSLTCTDTTTTQTLASVTSDLTTLASAAQSVDGLALFDEGSSFGNTSDDWVMTQTNEITLACTDGALAPASYSKLPIYRETCSSVGSLADSSGLGTLKGPSAGLSELYAWADGTHQIRADKTTRIKKYAVDNLAISELSRSQDEHLRHQQPCYVHSADSPLYADADQSDFYDTNSHTFKCEALSIGSMVIAEYVVIGHQRWAYSTYFPSELANGNARVAGMEIKVDISQSVSLATGQTFHYIQHVKTKNAEHVWQGGNVVRTSSSALEFLGRVLVKYSGDPMELVVETCILIGDTSKPNRFASFGTEPCFSWGADLIGAGTSNALVEILPKQVVWSDKADKTWCDNHSSAPTKAPVTSRRLLREIYDSEKAPGRREVSVMTGRRLLTDIESADVCASLHFEDCDETEGAIQAISSA